MTTFPRHKSISPAVAFQPPLPKRDNSTRRKCSPDFNQLASHSPILDGVVSRLPIIRHRTPNDWLSEFRRKFAFHLFLSRITKISLLVSLRSLIWNFNIYSDDESRLVGNQSIHPSNLSRINQQSLQCIPTNKSAGLLEFSIKLSVRLLRHETWSS